LLQSSPRSPHLSAIKGATTGYSPGCLEEVSSEIELPEEVILEIVPMVKEKEPQRWEHQKNPTLEFLGFAGSA
jgi:hypothetical protein